MSGIRLKINGEPGVIDIRALEIVIRNLHQMLNDFDHGISGDPKGTTDWIVSDLAMGSLVTEVRPRDKREDVSYGGRVSRGIIEGLEQIEKYGTTPPYLSERGMSYARNLLNVIGHYGASGIEITDPDIDMTVELTARATVNARQLIRPRQKSVGSIEGRIETISLHRGSRFVVYHSVTKKAVTCTFKDENLLSIAKDALGRRVNVSGIIRSNSKGEPLRVDSDNIRVLKSRIDIPSVDDLFGIDPLFTGDMTSDAYVRSMRSA